MTLPLEQFGPFRADGRLDLDGAMVAHEAIRALAGCPQEPLWHAEGDVWTHTRMVVEEMESLAGAFPSDEARLLRLAALWHDTGKPAVTQEIDGKIRSPGHSALSEDILRRAMWRADVFLPWDQDILVRQLVRWHGGPPHIERRKEMLSLPAEYSVTLRCDLLYALALADRRGRRTADGILTTFDLDLFKEAALEAGCWDRPFPFKSDHARFNYFASGNKTLTYQAYDDRRFEVTVLCGLPAAGKDHWILKHGAGQPVISLDEERARLGFEPDEDQAGVIFAAKEKAVEYLRAGESFIWNATNLIRDRRRDLLGWMARYGASIRIVHVRAPRSVTLRRNAKRRSPVPESVMEKCGIRFEPPSLRECHRLEVVETI